MCEQSDQYATDEQSVDWTDADWAGLYTPSMGMELRSRSGVYIEYDGMPNTVGALRLSMTRPDNVIIIQYIL